MLRTGAFYAKHFTIMINSVPYQAISRLSVSPALV